MKYIFYLLFILMESIENKIIVYLNLIYQLSEEDKTEILLSLEKLSEEDKAKILMVAYKRYKDFVENAKRLRNDITLVSNTMRDIDEKEEAEKILERII